MLRLVTYLSLLAGARAYQSAAGRLPTIESRVSLGRPAMFGGMKLGAALDAAGDHLANPAPPPQVCGNPFAPSTSHPSRRTLLLGALGTAVAVGNAKPASAGSFNAASTDQASDQVTVGLEGDYFSNYWSAKPDLEGGSEQLVSWKFKGTVPRVRIYLRRKKLGLSSYTLLASDIGEDVAAAEAARAKERQDAQTQLRKVQRQLLARLQRFLQAEEDSVNVLVAADDPAALEELAELLDAAAHSNEPFGLPPLPLRIHAISSVDEICACLSSQRIDLALISISMLDALRDVSDLELGEATVFVAMHSRETAALPFEVSELYGCFGVQDLLAWPPTLEATRRTLHRWMPRSDVNLAGTPPITHRLTLTPTLALY